MKINFDEIKDEGKETLKVSEKYRKVVW